MAYGLKASSCDALSFPELVSQISTLLIEFLSYHVPRMSFECYKDFI